MISEPLLFLSPADLAGCRGKTVFAPFPLLVRAEPHSPANWSWVSQGWRKSSNMSSGEHRRPLMALEWQGTEVLEPGGYKEKKQSNVYGTLILGDGHLEGEKNYGFF